MKPIKTATSNHNFGPPPNVTDGSIGDLPCQVVDLEAGTHYHGTGDVCECGEQPNVVLAHEEVPGPENRRPKPQPDGGRIHG